MKKSQGLTLNTIVIAVLVLIVLVTLALVFGGKIFNFSKKTSDIEESATVDIDVAKCRLECNKFNIICIRETDDNKYYISEGENCNEKLNFLEECKKNGFITKEPDSTYISPSSTTGDKEELMCKA